MFKNCHKGCEKDEKEKQKANHPPVANLYADVTSGDRPLTVQFDASDSTIYDSKEYICLFV